MKLLDALFGAPARQTSNWSFSDFLAYMGNQYPFAAGMTQTMHGSTESVGPGLEGMTTGAYKRSGVVFSVMQIRLQVFSQARFVFRRLRNGRPQDTFGTSALSVLERPWPGGTTADLLARAIQDVDLAGNFFATVRGGGMNRRVVRLRPDWVTIVYTDDPKLPDSELVGYVYHPDGQPGPDSITLDKREVAHFAPTPDPLAVHRGMSWLTPILREIEADMQATAHKQRFFENGATPNMVVKFDSTISEDEYNAWVDAFEEGHTGYFNAYKTLYLGGGADVQVVGKDMQQIDFKATQGTGETRIAMAGGIHPVVLGSSEGLSGSSLNAGNYSQARRRVADITFAHLWRNMAGSFSNLVEVPSDAELWFDADEIPFLQDDALDAANIRQADAGTIRTLVDGGYKPDAVVDAVTAGDMARLVGNHTGYLPVQVQRPGEKSSPPPDDSGDTE